MSGKTEYEITLLGDKKVGKTCLTKMYIKGTFDDEYLPTQGIRQFSVEKDYPFSFGKVKVVINDISGEAQPIIYKLFIQRADAIIICYDATNRDSFEHIKTNWYRLIKENKNKDLKLGIVSTKNEFVDLKKVKDEEGLNLAKEYEAIFQKLSTSYKTENVDKIFERIGELCLGGEDYIIPEISEEKEIEIEKPLEKDKNPKRDLEKIEKPLDKDKNPKRDLEKNQKKNQKKKKRYCCPI